MVLNSQLLILTSFGKAGHESQIQFQEENYEEVSSCSDSRNVVLYGL